MLTRYRGISLLEHQAKLQGVSKNWLPFRAVRVSSVRT